MKNYSLKQYNELAYEFAIRNPKVIELLKKPLSEETVMELRKLGINAISYTDDLDREIYSLQELYLDYEHLKDVIVQPYSPEGEGKIYNQESQEWIDDFKGNKTIYHPLKDKWLFQKESDIDALNRIKDLIETRGKKLSRLIYGETFINYDLVKFQKKTIYSIDPSGNNKKSINSDIKFIEKWIQPEKYLQLIPKFENIIKG